MALDNNSGNKELIVRWLGEVIHREVSKSDDEADMELVEECEETLRLLSNSVSYSEEELDERLKVILHGENKQEVRHDKSHRHVIRRIATIAACVALFLLVGIITAYAFVPSFQSYIKQVIGMSEGSSIESDGITFVKFGQSKYYGTFDELIEAEELGDAIIFPTGLPDEIRITKIYFAYSDDRAEVIVIFTDASILMSIETDLGIDLDELAVTSEEYDFNGIVSYVSESGGVCASVTVYKGYVYYISADTREKTTTILESIFDRSL